MSGMQPGLGHVPCAQRLQQWTKSAARVAIAAASASAVYRAQHVVQSNHFLLSVQPLIPNHMCLLSASPQLLAGGTGVHAAASML